MIETRKTATAALAEDLRHAVGSFVREVRRNTTGGSTAQDETLALLDGCGPMNVAALAHARGVAHQTMRLVVAQLEARGLVRSSADVADRRSRLFSISAAGQRELERARQMRAAGIAAMIETSLSEDERASLRDLIAVLNRMTAAASRP